jgi:hypothetical protein
VSANSDARDRLVGVWKLVSLEYEFKDTGERKATFGENPSGYLIFTPEGRMMALAEAQGRRPPQTDAERAAVFQTMVAYSGTDRVEGDKWIVDIDLAWNPAIRGTRQTRSIRIEGDRLHIVTEWRPNPNQGGKVTRGILVWRRA